MKKLFAAILFAFSVASAPAFAACSFLCNDGSGNGTFGNNLTVEGTLTVNGGGSTTFANLTVTGDLTVNGNTTLGNASADTLTINAGTWTYGANWTATRAAGALAAGISQILTETISYSGDAGGTTTAQAIRINNTGSGSNAIVENRTFDVRSNWSGSNTATTINSIVSSVSVTSTGAATNVRAFTSSINLTGAGNVSVADNYLVGPPVLSSTGAITTHNGFRVANIGNALATVAIGVKIDDFTSSTTMRGIQSSLSSGSGKHNLYIDGTAVNYLEGETRIGSNTATAGAEKLQINGSLSINSATLIRTYTAFTNGAAAAVGTLNNAPAAGNPTKWIPVNDNGTTRYIPAW